MLYPFDFDGNKLAAFIKLNQDKKEKAILIFHKALLIQLNDNLINTIIRKK